MAGLSLESQPRMRTRMRNALEHSELLVREAELRGRGGGMRVMRRRPTDRADGGAQADGRGHCGCGRGDLQLAGDREAASRDDDREARLLERCVPHEARRRVRGGGVRAAARAADEMVLETDLVELRELPVER